MAAETPTLLYTNNGANVYEILRKTVKCTILDIQNSILEKSPETSVKFNFKVITHNLDSTTTQIMLEDRPELFIHQTSVPKFIWIKA
jgi:hypothetical protein